VFLPARRSREIGAFHSALLARGAFVLGPLFGLLFGLLPFEGPRDAGAAIGASEYDVKAAFLFNFAKFVEWPAWTFERSGGAMVFSVVGDDPFGPALDRIARNEKVQGRPIIVKRVRRVEDLGPCHIVFIRGRGDAAVSSLIHQASAPYRLVVGEDPEFAERGGGIGFYFEQRRIKFTVNVGATERAGLKVSSKLLKIARVIGN
jgi:hypothetical protein